MSVNPKVTNVVFAGLGGQGVLKASDILAEAAFLAGFDVKKAEVHGMSQRGGSVSSDVRFGEKVHSPMSPEGEADFLVAIDSEQVRIHVHQLRLGGVLIEPALFLNPDEGIEDVDDLDADDSTPLNRRNLNVALLGALSVHLDLPESYWMEAIHANLPAKTHEANMEVFRVGREAAQPE